jgi:hypothetical protein
MRKRLLDEARALRAAFPNVEAMRRLPVSSLSPVANVEDVTAAEYLAGLRYLRDEMLVVQAGRATDLTVLDDEIACVERLAPPAVCAGSR